MLDFHNHLMPAVDDGAQGDDDVRHALAAFVEQGVEAVITTPHLDGSVTARPEVLAGRLEAFDVAWRRLVALARDAHPGLELDRGAEVKLDSPEPDLSDARVRLAGTPFALVEFPHLMIPPESARALFNLSANGWVPIVAHPERYAGIERRLDIVGEWRRVGARLQVNQGSVLGRYGPRAQAIALALLERGWVDYLASDYHARGAPHTAACRAALLERGAEEQAELLMKVNPARIPAGEVPIPVPPLPRKRGLVDRIFARFRS